MGEQLRRRKRKSKRLWSIAAEIIEDPQAALAQLQLAPLPHVDSCAPAHLDLSVLPIYVARVPAAPFTHCFPRSPAGAGSLIPFAPFAEIAGDLKQ